MTLNPVLRIDTQMIEAVRAHHDVSRASALERCREALARVGIASPDERLRSYPHQFSGGMRQRVAIAIALLNKPDLIIADEPTTALDVTIQGQILVEMQTLCRETGTGPHLDHARPVGDRRPRRRGVRDVRGPHRRVRDRGRGPRPPDASLHARPPRIGSQPQHARPPARADSRHDAVARCAWRRAARSASAARAPSTPAACAAARAVRPRRAARCVA